MDGIRIRTPLPADHLEIAAFIEGLMERYLARGLTAEGVAHLRASLRAGIIGQRLGGLTYPTWSPAFVAAAGSRIVGFGAVRNETHITQVEVAEGWQGRGIGHRLVRAMIEDVRRRSPRATAVTLNASAAGLISYLRMGFVTVGPRVQWHGIIAQPMTYRLAP